MSILLFILILLVGFFAGACFVLMLAYFLDTHNDREIMRRSKMVADYAKEYDVSVGMAYQTLKKLNFVY